MHVAVPDWATVTDYFLRALALDPANPMISLSVGLGYIHYGLKRQSSNRQYLVSQGLAFVFRYFQLQVESADPVEQKTAYFDAARTFQLLGLQSLAADYYNQALTVDPGAGNATAAARDLDVLAAFNQWSASIANNNLIASEETAKAWLVF